jgi:aryl-alcohol dehydrogenase-like predicted oxidoreductase
VGARNAAQLYENVKATEWEMTEDEFLRLDALSMPARKYPYEVFDPLKAPPDA